MQESVFNGANDKNKEEYGNFISLCGPLVDSSRLCNEELYSTFRGDAWDILTHFQSVRSAYKMERGEEMYRRWEERKCTEDGRGRNV